MSMDVDEIKTNATRLLARLLEDLERCESVEERREHLIYADQGFRQILYVGAGVCCEQCCGYGRRTYSSTSLWRRGMGGQMMTEGVCDACWGTGRTDIKGADLRAMDAHLEKSRVETSARWLVGQIGADYKRHQPYLREVISKLSRVRMKGGFWAARSRDVLAEVLGGLLDACERSEEANRETK